ncbi:MAG: filamentous hemagglutinin N-terminal domain-containing protein [Caulobacteraceae bacterium]|nr:filamentous hemagglutinin N-terminal domain-containing protein [Caulobacteraceae bacterium]
MAQARPNARLIAGRKRRWLAGSALGGVLGLTLGLAGAAAYPSNTTPTVQVGAGGSPPSIPAVAPAAGTGELDIVLGGARTILTWQDFNLAAGETVNFHFDQNSWIVLNRVTGGQMTLNGEINGLVGGAAGGNVWFSAPSGVVFGPNARVNVGGLLATTSGLVEDEAFLDSSQTTIGFEAPSGALAGVTVQAGARLNGAGGTLALVAPQVTTFAGSQIGGDADVFYGAATSFDVGFLPTADNDLSLINFVVPTGGGSASATPLTLAGATQANNVVIAHVSRADVLNAVIAAPGLIVAQTATSSGGDVILSSGIDIGGGVVASPSDGGRPAVSADFGQVVAEGGIRIEMRGPAAQTSFSADSLQAGASVESRTGRFAVTNAGQSLSAGTYVYVDAPQGIDAEGIGAGGMVSLYATADGTSDGAGSGVIDVGEVTAGGDIFAAGQRVLSPQLASGGAVGVLTSGATGATPILLGHVLGRTGVDLAAQNGSIFVDRVTLTGVGVTGSGEPHFTASAQPANADVVFGVSVPGALNGPAGGYTAAIAAGRDILVNLDSGADFQSLEAGRDVVVTTTGPLSVGFADASRDLRLSGTTVSLDELAGPLSRDIAINATAGGFVAPGDLAAGRDLSITATGDVSASALDGATVTVRGANVTTGQIAGQTSVDAAATGALTTGSVSADGGSVRLAGAGGVTSGLVSSQTTTDIAGGDVDVVDIGAGGAVHVSGGAIQAGTVTGGSTVDVVGSGPVSFDTLTAAGAARVAGSDLDIGESLTASSLQVEASAGNLRLGGPAGPSPAGTLVIDNAEFQRIHVTDQASFYAGPTTAASPRGDITVLDLSVDLSRVPRLNLYAGTGNDVRVTGVLAPTASGGVLNIGSSDAAWRPRRILVSGSIGAASGSPQAGFTGVRAFGQVNLAATDDIIIGSQRFIDLIIPTPASEIDIARGLPSGAAPTADEAGRVFLAAGTLSLAANDRIVQQNTGTAADQNGLYLANALTGSRGDTVLTLGSTPLVDLFGGFIDQAGVLQTGLQAALAPELRRPADAPFLRTVRFNGCSIGSASGCVVSGGPETGFRIEEFLLARPDQITDQPLLSTAPEAEDEDETDPVVTGAGNEEIWRSRK